MTLWVDIDDLLFHLIRHGRPSGIQRVVFELGAALRTLHGENVQFVRRGPDPENPYDFRTIDWKALNAAFHQNMDKEPNATPFLRSIAPVSFPAKKEGGAKSRTNGLSMLLGLEREVLNSTMELAGILARKANASVRGQLRKRPDSRSLLSSPLYPGTGESDGAHLADCARPGDAFVTLGSPWNHNTYLQTVRWMRDELRMSFALLMHDLVPIRCPEWCDQGIITTFSAWHRAILPVADVIFANSDATARDVRAYLAETNLGAHRDVHTVPLGTGFGLADAPAAPEPLVNGPYALFVSTIEVRKNHALLFRVWRKLLEDMPADDVPTLVFAGREGWLVSDLMQQLDNAAWLDGKIRFIENPSDAELRRLYADCSFTLFPSFFEGWGLPVTESLSMGRPCIASNTTSIPEAGGALSRYFDPTNLHDAYTVIRQTIEDADDLAAWTDEVRRSFRPVPWTDGAKVILRHLTNDPTL